MKSIIINEFEDHKKAIDNTISKLVPSIEKAAQLAISSLKNGNKILFCGNGGSAADAQHLAAELSGRYKVERKGLAGIAITTDTSAITAIGNDYGFDKIFERQVEALAISGDLLFGISTSGSSTNVINAFKMAKKIGCLTIGLTGKDGGNFGEFCDLNIIVPSMDTPRIQETHILIGHIICQLIDNAFKSD